MNPDWINALIGGGLLGTGAGLLLLGNGRIAGVSTMVGELVERPMRTDFIEKLLFLFGIMTVPVAYYMLTGGPEIEITSNIPVIIAGGILLGIGARMGSGCTSGHGICGTARLSKRSILAVLTFISTGVATVTLMNLFV